MCELSARSNFETPTASETQSLNAKGSMKAYSKAAIEAFVNKHFDLLSVLSTPKGPYKKKSKSKDDLTPIGDQKTKSKASKKDVANEPIPIQDSGKSEAQASSDIVEAPPDESTGTKSTTQFTCKHCKHMFRDTSNAKALEHILLVEGAQITVCTDPQIEKEDLKILLHHGMRKAKGYEARLTKHENIGRITKEQPLLQSVEKMAISERQMYEQQKEQIKAALSKGDFAAHKEIDANFVAWLKKIAPEYRPPTLKEIDAIREDLNRERIEVRNNSLKAMGPGGIVSDGCRGKLHESMINFLFIEG